MSEKASSDRPPATACIMKALITDIRFLLRTPPLDCRDSRARPLDVNHALRDVAALLLTGKARSYVKRRSLFGRFCTGLLRHGTGRREAESGGVVGRGRFVEGSRMA